LNKNTVLRLYIVSGGLFLFWTLLIVFSSLKDIGAEKEKTLSLARHEAITIFNKDQAVRLWSSGHGGVYVPVSEKTPPNPHLSHIAERDIVTPSGRQLTLMNPAYMIRQIMEDYEKIYGAKGHITSLKPLNPKNKPDECERAALHAFEANGEKEIFTIDDSGKELFLRLIKPMLTTEGCLKCHGSQGYKIGEVRGGVGVKLSLTPYLLLEKKSIKNVIVTHTLFWSIGLVALIGFTFLEKQRVEKEILFNEKLEYSNNELERALKDRKSVV
jgi:hypothetical protein